MQGMADMIAAQAEMDTELETLKSTAETTTKESADKSADYEKRIADLEAFVNQTPTGTHDKKSNVSKEQAEKIQDAQGPVEYDPAFGDMKIPLNRSNTS